MIQNTNYGASKTYVNTKVDKLTTSGLKAYTHDGTTQGEIEVSNTYTPSTLALRDANGRMQAADPASGATDKTLTTANWVSQTGGNRPNNLIHSGGVERMTATKELYGGANTHIQLVSQYIPSTGGPFNEGAPNITFLSNDNVELGRIFLRQQNGVLKIVARIYNHDTTYKEVVIIEANN